MNISYYLYQNNDNKYQQLELKNKYIETWRDYLIFDTQFGWGVETYKCYNKFLCDGTFLSYSADVK